MRQSSKPSFSTTEAVQKNRRATRFTERSRGRMLYSGRIVGGTPFLGWKFDLSHTTEGTHFVYFRAPGEKKKKTGQRLPYLLLAEPCRAIRHSDGN